ncbi:hypothetical protein [Xenorhabdus lircayensis]|uniref:Uncharacterized protein n=1 Tax=Xenorhabdus lircayensis TaxID=2763499 RepID=A0ABS0U1K8_9GAMM|nr:hypothetical protein [Xenorhabdus lircayensis]
MNLIYPSIKIHGEHELAHNNNEEKVKNGELGAYAVTQLDFILTGKLDVTFGWESDEKGDWSFKKIAY